MSADDIKLPMLNQTDANLQPQPQPLSQHHKHHPHRHHRHGRGSWNGGSVDGGAGNEAALRHHRDPDKPAKLRYCFGMNVIIIIACIFFVIAIISKDWFGIGSLMSSADMNLYRCYCYCCVVSLCCCYCYCCFVCLFTVSRAGLYLEFAEFIAFIRH